MRPILTEIGSKNNLHSDPSINRFRALAVRLITPNVKDESFSVINRGRVDNRREKCKCLAIIIHPIKAR